MSPNDLNAFLWNCVNDLGWYYWSIAVVLALWGLAQLYRLDEALSVASRLMRIAATLACILLLASPWFNVAGAIAFPLAMFAMVTMLTQRANVYAARRTNVRNYCSAVPGIVSNATKTVVQAAVAPQRMT